MMKYIFPALVLFFAGSVPANAAPIAAAFVAITGALKTSMLLATLAKMAGSMILSAIAQKMQAKKLGQQQATKTEVKFQVEMGDDLALSFVVGNYATAGRRKYIGSWGKNTRFITQVIEVSCMPMPWLAAIWMDAERGNILSGRQGRIAQANPGDAADVLEQDWGAGGTGVVLGHPVEVGRLQGRKRLWIRIMDGSQTTVDPLLGYAFAGANPYPWSGIGTGKSYIVVTTEYDKDFLNSLPNFLFEPMGLAMYDPRKDSTAGGSGSHRWGNRATYEPSTNPMVIAYNVARGIYLGSEWVYGGKNLAAWRLPFAEWVASMNACDRITPGTLEPAYRCGYEINVDEPPADFLEELGRCCNTRFAEVGGQLKPCTDLPASSVFTITDEDLIITAGHSMSPFFPVSDTFNTLTASYPEPVERWSNKDAPIRQLEGAVEADGGRYLPTGVKYTMVPWANQVQRLMVSQLQDYRRMRQHNITLPPKAYVLEPLDMITWNSNRNGYAAKRFIVEHVQKLPGFLTVISLREVDPSDYDWSSDFQLPYVAVPPVNPIPIAQGIPGFNAEAVVLLDDLGRPRKPGIRITCGGNEAGVTHIRVRVFQATTPVFDVLLPYEAPYVWTMTEVAPETTYRVQALLVSEFMALSNWSSVINVTTLSGQILESELGQNVLDRISEIAAEMGIPTVLVLPAEGERPNQIVLNQSDGFLYRWDDVANTWVTDIVEPNLPNNFITANHIAANAVIASKIAGGAVTAQKIDTLSFSSAGLAIFGGGIQSDNWNNAGLGWRINRNGELTVPNASIKNAHIENLAVDTIKIANNAVTIQRSQWAESQFTMTFNAPYGGIPLIVMLCATMEARNLSNEAGGWSEPSRVRLEHNEFEHGQMFYQNLGTVGEQSIRTTSIWQFGTVNGQNRIRVSPEWYLGGATPPSWQGTAPWATHRVREIILVVLEGRK